MRFRRSLGLLGVWCFARVVQAGPIVGPAVAVDRPAVSPSANMEKAPTLASDGNQYLVLWKDYREARPWNSRLMGARIDRSGKALDPHGFVVGGPAQDVSVAFGGDRYLVVWVGDDRNISTGMFAARVSRDGQVLDARPIELWKSNKVGPRPTVAWNGSVFQVLWTDGRPPAQGGGVRSARIDKDGTVIGAAAFDVSPNGALGGEALLASDGQQFAIFFRREPAGAPPGASHVHLAKVGSDGTVPDPSGRLLIPGAGNESQDFPSVCFDGDNYHLAWRQTEPGPAFPASVRGALISKEGTLVATPVVLWPGSTSQAFGPIACGAGGSAVSGETGLARMDRMGRRMDVAPLSVSSDPTAPAITTAAGAGTDFLVVWNHRTALMTTPVSGDAAAQPSGRRLFDATNRQLSPAVARGAGNYLAVWRDDRNGDQRIYGTLLGNEGAPTGAEAIPLGVDEGGLAVPVVAWNGLHYVIAWADGKAQAIRAVRVDGQGKVIGTEARVAGQAWQSVVGLASDGDGTLLAWAQPKFPPAPNDGGLSSPRADVIVARLDASGLPARPLTIGAGNFVDNSAPSVAYGGDSYLVTWIRVSGAAAAVNARLVNRAEDQIPSQALTVLGKAPEGSLPPEAAWDGKQFLVVWGDGQRLVGQRVGRDGVAIDAAAAPLAPVKEDLRSFSLAWNGQHFLLGWRSSYQYAPAAYATRVASDRTLPDGDGFLVAESVAGLGGVGIGLASAGSSRWLAVYDRYESASELQAVRVSARVLTDCTGASCPPAVLTPPDAGLADVDASVEGGSRGPMPDAGIADAAATDGRVADSTDVGTSGGRDAASPAVSSDGCSCRVLRPHTDAPPSWSPC